MATGDFPVGGLNDEAVQHQAHHLWTMLDEMSERDPASYRAFIDKHIKEGKEAMKPPAPHMSVSTHILGKQRLFVNVLEWLPIKAPTCNEDPIPVMGGPMYKGKDKQGAYTAISIGFNPSVLTDFGRDSSLVAERRMLVNLALDYICDQHKVKVSRDYTLLGPDELCKGPEKLAIESLTQKTPFREQSMDNELSELEKMFGPMAAGCKESLLKEVSNMTLNNEESVQSERPLPEIRIGAEPKIAKPGLIQEVSNSEAKTETPHYDMIVQDGEPPCVLLKVKLPQVASVSQCQLDISQNDLCLHADGLYHLEVELPRPILEDDAQAKFSKRSSTLTLTLPISL